MESSESSSLISVEKPKDIKRHVLKFKTEQNGLLLKIHHTINSDDGQIRIRFINVAISDSNEVIAAIDHRGNIFVFQLSSKKYWQLPDKIPNSTVIKFVPNKNYNVLIGNKSGFVYEIEIYNGLTARCMKTFSSKINQILFSSTLNGFLVTTNTGIKIYDLDKFIKMYEYSALAAPPTYSTTTTSTSQNQNPNLNQKLNERAINVIKLTQIDDKFLMCLSDDSINICGLNGNHGLKILKQIYPVKLREKYLMKTNNKIELLDYCNDSSDELYVEKVIKTVTLDYRRGMISDIAFNDAGNEFVMSCFDGSMTIFSSTWDVKKVIKFQNIIMKQIEFLSSQEQHQKYIIARSTENSLSIFDPNHSSAKIFISKSNCYKFSLSMNGRILANVEESGEILVYNLDFHLALIRKSFSDALLVNDYEGRSYGKTNSDAKLNYIQNELSKALPKSRVLPILKEFGEYPEKYRQMIWKTILKLPQNENAFKLLLQRGYHSCVSNYGNSFPLSDQKQLYQLKKIVSCLAYWSNLFGHVEFLPNFVFPFLKLFKQDAIGCFETIATILYNHCQLWFEFAPVELPYNYLGMVDNLLQEFEPKLMEFYRENNISSKIYAISLMESAFSEVFDAQQWTQLWDHVVSNEPHFLVFCIVSYSIIQKQLIMKYDNRESIEYFFHEQNFIDFRKYIKKPLGPNEFVMNSK